MSAARTLATLLDGAVTLPPALAAREIVGLTLDSRAVQPGDAFVALAGTRSHGLVHAADALRAGAACVLFEPADADRAPASSDIVAVPGLRARLGTIADRFHDTPSATLTVVGVTGTNGKTSTVQLLAQALDLLGHGPCGTIGTLGVGLSGELRAGERTTPDVIGVHRTLAELRDRGARAVAMEVSSHALDQGRVDAVRFAIAVFTNLSRDHLDYHGDMEAYGAAKARLFDWPGLAATVLNIDDPFGRRLAATTTSVNLWTVGSRSVDARLRADAVRLLPHGLGFTLREASAEVQVEAPLFGRFNVDNLLAAAACLRALGVPLHDLAAIFPRLQPVPGRMNRVAGGTAAAPQVVVDYAHTPDALEQALSSLREHATGKLLCVFGCGGERDRGKRPEMAAIAERLADRVVVTDDNPRNEDGDAIVQQIMAGFRDAAAVTVERDRARAIDAAISAAGADDIVLVAGKGHEPYQEIAGRKLPFDDGAVARARLEEAR